MIDCKDTEHSQSSSDHPLSHAELLNTRFHETFLCPNTTELLVIGKDDRELFSYVELTIRGCDLPDDQCLDSNEVDNTYFNFF